jgi:hypothetical protein
MAAALVRRATLDGVPGAELDRLRELGFDRVWLRYMGGIGSSCPAD